LLTLFSHKATICREIVVNNDVNSGVFAQTSIKCYKRLYADLSNLILIQGMGIIGHLSVGTALSETEGTVYKSAVGCKKHT